MDASDPNPPIVSTVRAVRRVPLGELADRSAQARAENAGVAFNSAV